MKRFSLFTILFTIVLSLGPGYLYAGENGSDAGTDSVKGISTAESAISDGGSDALSDSQQPLSTDKAAIAATSSTPQAVIPNPISFHSGEHLVGASLGLAFPTNLSTADVMMDLRLEYQYFFPYSISLAAGAAYLTSFAKTKEFLVSGGIRYHQTLPWPIALVYGLDFVGGGLFDVRNADLGYLGGRVTIGANYYIRGGRHKMGAGASLVADIGSSISERNAAIATIGLVFTFNYHL